MNEHNALMVNQKRFVGNNYINRAYYKQSSG